MLNVKPDVLSALKTIEELKDVFISFPDDFTKLPCASYYEALNSIAEDADDDEYLSEIIFVIDIWGETSSITSALAIKVDAAMKTISFRREFSADIDDSQSSIRHKSMRYRLIK